MCQLHGYTILIELAFFEYESISKSIKFFLPFFFNGTFNFHNWPFFLLASVIYNAFVATPSNIALLGSTYSLIFHNFSSTFFKNCES